MQLANSRDQIEGRWTALAHELLGIVTVRFVAQQADFPLAWIIFAKVDVDDVEHQSATSGANKHLCLLAFSLEGYECCLVFVSLFGSQLVVFSFSLLFHSFNGDPLIVGEEERRKGMRSRVEQRFAIRGASHQSASLDFVPFRETLKMPHTQFLFLKFLSWKAIV